MSWLLKTGKNKQGDASSPLTATYTKAAIHSIESGAKDGSTYDNLYQYTAVPNDQGTYDVQERFIARSGGKLAGGAKVSLVGKSDTFAQAVMFAGNCLNDKIIELAHHTGKQIETEETRGPLVKADNERPDIEWRSNSDQSIMLESRRAIAATGQGRRALRL